MYTLFALAKKVVSKVLSFIDFRMNLMCAKVALGVVQRPSLTPLQPSKNLACFPQKCVENEPVCENYPIFWEMIFERSSVESVAVCGSLSTNVLRQIDHLP